MIVQKAIKHKHNFSSRASSEAKCEDASDSQSSLKNQIKQLYGAQYEPNRLNHLFER